MSRTTSSLTLIGCQPLWPWLVTPQVKGELPKAYKVGDRTYKVHSADS